MLLSYIGLIFFNLAFLSPILRYFNGQTLRILYLILGIVEIYIYITNKPINFYQEYNITRNFQSNELRQAYKRIMLDYHPDRNTQITSEQFNYLKNINEVLKSEEAKKQYDQYGVVLENNINPLPALIYRIKLTRLLFYMILFLIQLVNTQDQKSQSQQITVLVAILGYADFYLIERPEYFQNSTFFVSLALYEFLNIYRIVVTILISYKLAVVKNQQHNRNLQLKQLDQKTINELVNEHQEFLQTQNSKKQKVLNGFLMIGLTFYTLCNFFDLWDFFMKLFNKILESKQDL